MTISRRSLLVAGGVSAGAVLTGCTVPAPAPAAPAVPEPLALPDLGALETRYARRIGAHVLDTGSGASASHRADERFLMCSTVKALMAAFVLHLSTTDPGLLDRRVTYTAADLVEYAPVTAPRVGTGMSVAELCTAAVTVSDNTAHNLLLRETGGPAALTAYLRGLGDTVTRADRTEPALNEPAGEQDTTTPAAMSATLRALTVGDGLPRAQRDRLTSWLRANTTGDAQIRAGVPTGWQVGDKTGSGPAGEKNDVGLLAPPQGAPLVLTVFTVPTDRDDERGAEVVAATTRAAVAALDGTGR
ncbi:class A beta-lactamase [Pseudonocardia pini]|uniref:class A beta-lactamase n=1 Tax=Pseudonocardia pini TaxID=2758030 RepID=UPI0015F0F96F|nr:class A beta-lactamase [Pseudonocardia pini]